MRKILKDCFASLAMTLVCATASFATPPVSIDLKYDLDNGSLHVEAAHPSFNLDKSYVRLMNVYVNGDLVSTFNYFRQNDYEKFSDDVSLTAQAGDVIKVELFCTLGGQMSKELTVAKPEASPPDQSANSAADPPPVPQAQATLVRNIVMEGFVLEEEKSQFVKLFKPYRNKRLSEADIDRIFQGVKDIYERQGYQQLVSITYQIDKHHRLVFTVLMTS